MQYKHGTSLYLIFKREFLIRFKTKSFWILTLLAPLLLSALLLSPVWINKNNLEQKVVIVYDHAHIIGEILIQKKSTQFLRYVNADDLLSMDDAIDRYDRNKDTLVLNIPENFIRNRKPLVELFNKQASGLFAINKIKDDLYDIRRKLIVYSTVKFDLEQFEKRIEGKVTVIVQGQGVGVQIQYYLSIAFAFLLFILIYIYGTQVMNSVGEEKRNRIIEIILSSIPAKSLLNGKILGIGLLGLIQFGFITLLTMVCLTIFDYFFGINTQELIQNQLPSLTQTGALDAEELVVTSSSLFQESLSQYLAILKSFSWYLFLVLPVLFIGGFVLYANFFALLGSVKELHTDNQFWLIPVLAPLLISVLIAFTILDQPHSNLAFWASIFPLSAPIVLPARLAFMDLSSDWWQVVVALFFMILSIYASLQFTTRVYKTAILLYGQKMSVRNMWKWFKQSKE